MPRDQLPIIKVVGISASGKSTLVSGLRTAGYDARPVSQEHSDVPELWRQFGFSRVLIFLDNDLLGQRTRRPDVAWSEEALALERRRVQDAREHADLRLNTANLTADQVLGLVLAFLEANRIRRSATPLPPLPRTGGAKTE
jgi:RNase adaptor protein for sRNA GlmZ degradation